jgi:hypothetical protein
LLGFEATGLTGDWDSRPQASRIVGIRGHRPRWFVWIQGHRPHGLLGFEVTGHLVGVGIVLAVVAAELSYWYGPSRDVDVAMGSPRRQLGPCLIPRTTML